MTHWILAALLLLHGLIHLLGFEKAFGLARLQQLSANISRPWGGLWGACALLFVLAAVLLVAGVSWWWMLAAVALVASQTLVFVFWQDAKLGTIANLLVLVPVLLAFGSWRFENRVAEELALMAADEPGEIRQAIDEDDLARLPPPVGDWLVRAGVYGRSPARSVRLQQKGELQRAPKEAWLPFQAEQHFFIPEPAFLWQADVRAGRGLSLAGLDGYRSGKGRMRIELLSLWPVVNATGPKIDQGALLRFLAETMWFPSAALEPYIRWEAVDEKSARATMNYGGVEASGIFRFDAQGDVIGFEARRYRDEVLEDWIIENDPESFEQLAGVRIPTRSTVTWRDEAGEKWTWLRLEVEAVERDA